MQLLGQFGIILIITFLGEMMHYFIPLPIPASIYGLVLMLFCLSTKIIKLHRVIDAAHFLLDIMPSMFIPAAVGLIVVWGDLQKILLPIVVITFLTTIIVMVVTGKSSQKIIQKQRKEDESSERISM